MIERFEGIWVSSEDHLEMFNSMKKNKVDINKVQDLEPTNPYYNFPRVSLNGRLFPLIYKNKATVFIDSNSITVKPNVTDITDNYFGINTTEEHVIDYSHIENIDISKPRYAIIPYFDNSWVRIRVKNDVSAINLLISFSGAGLVMRKIKKLNIVLFQLISRKMKLNISH